jgi:hypothetical protein
MSDAEITFASSLAMFEAQIFSCLPGVAHFKYASAQVMILSDVRPSGMARVGGSAGVPMPHNLKGRCTNCNIGVLAWLLFLLLSPCVLLRRMSW